MPSLGAAAAAAAAAYLLLAEVAGRGESPWPCNAEAKIAKNKMTGQKKKGKGHRAHTGAHTDRIKTYTLMHGEIDR